MAFRDLPSVDRLIQAARLQLDGAVGHALLRETVRSELTATRAALRSATPIDISLDALIARVHARLRRELTPSLRPVINATGVIIQTNLGRAPLSVAAIHAMARVGASYSNLEYDLGQGQRGSRSEHLEGLLTRLSGSEAALAVNNNAAAVYLALITLAAGREVVIARGQAVEIGGGFRIPDLLRQSGAILVEVGTTNRTYAHDYAAALNTRSALLLRVHSSNFRLVGFVHETPLEEMVAVGREHSVPVLDDLGSGTLIPTSQFGLAPEPTVQESIRAGADLVTFSGDKLLGGPQAGLIVGRRTLVEQLRRHPLARALRVDKSTIAGLEATLTSYLHGRATEEIPVWRMIAALQDRLRERAVALATQLDRLGLHAEPCPCQSTVGGGSLPGETLASFGVRVNPGLQGADALAAELRRGTPAIVMRINEGQLLFDLRTVDPEEETVVIERLREAYR